MVVVLCEESLTMEAYSILPALIKAIDFAKADKDHELLREVLEVCELLGRYFSPETYIRYIFPRLSGDPTVVQFATDASSRCTVLEVLGSLLTGSKTTLVAENFFRITDVLADPFIVPIDSAMLRHCALNIWETVLVTMEIDNAILKETQYALKGRVKSIKDAFKTLLIDVNYSETQSKATACLKKFSKALNSGDHNSTQEMFANMGCDVLNDTYSNYSVEEDWSPQYSQHLILDTLIRCPLTLKSSKFDLASSFHFISSVVSLYNSKTLPNSSYAVFLRTFASLLTFLLKSFLRGLVATPTSLIELGQEARITSPEQQLIMHHILSSALELKFSYIYETFVTDSRWNSSDDLQLVRFTLVEALYDSLEDLNIAAPQEALVVYILTNIIPMSTKPDMGASVRITSSLLVFKIIKNISAMMQVKSIVTWGKVSADVKVRAAFLTKKFHLKSLINVLLSMLSDSDDQVVVTTLETLTLALHFFAPEIEGELFPLHLVLEAVFQSSLSINLREDQNFYNLLDFILRSACTIDLEMFERILQSFESSIDRTACVGGLLDLIHGLEDHIVTIRSLQV